MKQVRRPLVGVVALFVGAIAVDRIGIERGGNAIGLDAYAIAAASVLAAFALRGLRRSPWALPAVALGTLALSSLFIAPSAPVDTYLLLTELAFVTLAAILGRSLAAAVDGLDEALSVMAVGDSPALDIEGPAASNEIHTEMARSRRHDRPLSVTVLEPDQESLAQAIAAAGPEVGRALRERFTFSKLARAVGGQLRRSDLLFEHRPSGRLFVVSPETGTDGTDLLVARVSAAAADSGVQVRTGSASFPIDAISFEHLVEHAEKALDAGVEPEPVLRAVEEGGMSG